MEAADVVAALAGNGGHAVKGLRDAAIVAVMSDAMLRVSELCGLDVADLEAEAPLTLTIRRSKNRPDRPGGGFAAPKGNGPPYAALA